MRSLNNDFIIYSIHYVLVLAIVFYCVKFIYKKHQTRDLTHISKFNIGVISIYIFAVMYVTGIISAVLIPYEYYTKHYIIPRLHPDYENSFILFKSTLNYIRFSKINWFLLLKNVGGNTLLLLPYGFIVTHFKKDKNVKKIMMIGFMTSIIIESTQLSLGRIFDLDDILWNTIGYYIGYLIYRLFAKMKVLIIHK